ncbi:MAG: succinylglutamate-semialdehyde dehydrogenase [Deltaproteobacteria bacterium]
MTSRPLFVNNRWIEGNGEAFSSKDPATGETTFEGLGATAEQVNDAVAAARRAFESWAESDIADRNTCLEAFREQLASHKESLADAISRDTGKPLWESLTEVDAMIGKIALSVEAYHDRCRTITGEMSGAVTATRFKPHGVVAVLGPFNLPAHLPNGHMVPALLAGNCVVFKPSRQAALVGARMVELWEAAGIPAGVVNMVQGGRETGNALSQHHDLDGLFFTGSAETGKALHTALAGHPEKIIALEMGGNNPLIVWEINDLQSAAYLTVLSAFITAGQRCTCARRLIVREGREGDAFVEQLVSMTGAIKVGPYTDRPEPFMGPVISAHAAGELLAAQKSFSERGGTVLLEMRSLNELGTMLSPGIMDVSRVPDRPDAELFGPFLQLIRVPDFRAALEEANNTSYGLAAGLISDSAELFETFFRKIRAGVINWNRQTTGASSRMPFGGIKSSGNHRPSAYYAADYCSYPVASIEMDRLVKPGRVLPGLSL